MSLAFVVATIVLSPIMAEDGPMRFVATGVGDEPVRWVVDGVAVATTRDGEAARIHLAAGAHRVEAQSAALGAWQALARPDPDEPAWQAVQAWYGEHTAQRAVPGAPLAATVLLLLGLAIQAKRT